MRLIYVVCFLMFAALVNCSVDQKVRGACPGCSAEAVQTITKLSNQGFNCQGVRCQGMLRDYPKPINIFIPPRLNFSETAMIAYHLHGWRLTDADDPFLGDTGDYGAFLARSGANVILIIPESEGKNATYASALGTPEQLNTFLEQVENVLLGAQVPLTMASPRLLSGHSGAYVAMGLFGDWAAHGLIPKFQSLRSMALFDSAYGYRKGLVDVMAILCGNSPGVYMLTYNPDDGSAGKRDTNRQIVSELNSRFNCAQTRVMDLPDTMSRHVEFPMNHMSDFFRYSKSLQQRKPSW